MKWEVVSLIDLIQARVQAPRNEDGSYNLFVVPAGHKVQVLNYETGVLLKDVSEASH